METSNEHDSFCFSRGADNERGLRLSISHAEDGAAETSLVVPARFSGWKSITHGCLLSTLLNEIMARACIGIARGAVAAELNVRFQKPMEAGSRIRAMGKVRESRGQVLAPQDIGVLAASGIEEVPVSIPPATLILPTGLEICAPGQRLEPGQIYDSSGPQLAAMHGPTCREGPVADPDSFDGSAAGA
jgi:uncharacterized protein (TIGR00369 family)